ncbi:hypothetical protein LSS_18778 [Leptospira santarosai serovar Shermani str. LT 821]|uniref:Uncharacterized protein n=1 Tax=Leptospira santarosai serovar Shermani str. LT 821 TaxID=758847 RepID=K8Y5X6_9LEPT|nr:hypothetical protein LSS_18778 [Leptospira santarosai serovar Shermani str. LT 821]
MKGWFLILLLIPTLLFSESSVSDDCTFKGRKSYGRIILVPQSGSSRSKSLLLSVYLQFSSIYEKRSTL